MFERAVEAGAAAAAIWTPESAGPGDGSRCCSLCFRRFRALVLDGPLGGLPHAVAHVVVVDVAATIHARAGTVAVPRAADDAASRRRAEAEGALLVVALEELGAARDRLAELRDRYTEPAVAEYLGRHRSDSAPWIGS